MNVLRVFLCADQVREIGCSSGAVCSGDGWAIPETLPYGSRTIACQLRIAWQLELPSPRHPRPRPGLVRSHGRSNARERIVQGPEHVHSAGSLELAFAVLPGGNANGHRACLVRGRDVEGRVADDEHIIG